MKRLISLFLSISIALGGICYADQPSLFAKNNPDILKYEYARSYISALTYIKAVHERSLKSNPAKIYKNAKDLTLMRGFVANLIKDNADLRIAKNYLLRYVKADNQNALMRKSADTFIMACNTVIAINDKEKEIWDQWNAIKANKLDSRVNETAFLKAQEELAVKRKEAFRGVIEASILLSKVLRSDQNKNEKGKLLAITAAERKKLLRNLDEVGTKNMDWGLKPGQSFQEASVAVLREVLEDPIYKTLP